MNEKIFEILMQLFALVTDRKDGVKEQSRLVVEAYLRGKLSINLAQKYLKIFDKYLDEYLVDNTKSDELKRLSSSSVKILKICNRINEELHLKEKFIVLIQLIEYTLIDGHMSQVEQEYIHTVGESFNISKTEYTNIIAFIKNDIESAADKNNFLYIDSNQDCSVKHIYDHGMEGHIRVLYVHSINTFFFIYSGFRDLTLNGRTITPAQTIMMNNGAIIRGARINTIYQNAVANMFFSNNISEKTTFSGQNISYNYKNSTNGLKPFSFSVESGTMVGIMGGSGTGKSTLLNVLTGKYKMNTGHIFINGHEIKSGQKLPEGIVGLVPQDDLLIEELTVFQNLYYNACLCLGNLKYDEVEKQVDKLLADLGLSDIKNLRVGNSINTVISGGQRKRLNIALELIREPAVLFVDEPTSGLSSTDSETVMQLLKQQAINGKIIIVNIHQPSSDIFKLFDKLWVMDKGGYVIYNGNPIEAVSYFKLMIDYADAGQNECPECGNVNPDQMLQIIEAKIVNEHGDFTETRKVTPEQWYELYKKNFTQNYTESQKQEKTPLPKVKYKIAGLPRQFKVFLKRNVLAKLTNKQYLAITFIESPLLAFILGFFTKYINDEGQYIFADNKNLPVFLFMIVVVALFTGLTSSAEEIIRDRKILEREKLLNLNWLSYINGKVLTMFLISAIQTISFIIVANRILEIKGMTTSYWFVMFTTACTANMIGLNISALLNSVISIYILIPFILVPQLLLGGAMIDFDDLHKSVSDKINVPFIGDLMVSRWSYEALAVDQFANNKYEREFFYLDMEKSRDIYLSTYLMSELDNITSKCIKLKKQPDSYQEYVENLKLLKNETEYINYRNPDIHFEHTEDFIPEKFNDTIGNFLQLFLRAQKEYYSEAANEINMMREQLLKHLEDSLGKDGLYEFQQDYYNDKLAEIVLNKRALKKIYHAPNNRLIQKKDPIFMEPVSDIGRAHFYAPVKIIHNHRFPTYQFNMTILWLLSFLMYLTLLINNGAGRKLTSTKHRHKKNRQIF